ncbi:MAG: flagellar biosynthesis protein FlhA [Gammaproteobacteria bacterium]|nr:MAG: flagellar biosynthesis protein FlhA [Gammaproteobacteria bacterium]
MNGLRGIGRNGLGAPILLLLMMSMMVLPLPPFALDMLFTFNISLALVVLLATIYSKRPLDFAVFPTVLLITTLMRLALNIASTRVVLLRGHTGTDAAGRVIEAFGDFVIGGNYTVGFVVFMILVIINFVVVTKGAGRVSEVSARFTLDAMPGKQMAIDADLNAGIINQEEARARREEIAREADFYGAMDGASKFVRGDAVAGLLILVINILGGLAIGTLQHDMTVSEAARVFVLLTIGDGLVAQIPALLLSTAAAIMVTRVSSAQDMGSQIVRQIFDNPRTLAVTAGVIGLIGIIPGMPNLPFLLVALSGATAAWFMARRRHEAEEEAAAVPAPPAEEPVRELGWEDVGQVDVVGLEVGYRLIPMVDKSQDGRLLSRIRGVRKKLSRELGFLIPAVHIRDNLDLPPTSYRITLHGATVAQAEVQPERELAINPGTVFGQLEGVTTRDPVFGLEAVWIAPEQHEQAQALGYTVVDAGTVIATHLSQVLQQHAHELLGFDEVQKLLERLGERHPKLVEDLVPKVVSLPVLVRVLQNLLREQVPIRDMRTIVEVVAEHAPRSQDPGVLTAQVRIALGRIIVEQINGLEPELPVITLDGMLEQLLQKSLQAVGESGGAIEPGLAARILDSIRQLKQQQDNAGQPTVLLVADNLREFLARFIGQSVPGIHVLGFSELPQDKQLRIVATLGGGQELPQGG